MYCCTWKLLCAWICETWWDSVPKYAVWDERILLCWWITGQTNLSCTSNSNATSAHTFTENVCMAGAQVTHSSSLPILFICLNQQFSILNLCSMHFFSCPYFPLASFIMINWNRDKQYPFHISCCHGAPDFYLTVKIWAEKNNVCRTQEEGVRSTPPFQSLVKAGDVTSGFLEGVMDLPVDGIWLVLWK